MTGFVFKTEPYAHQREAFFATRDAEMKAIFWEMGLGKSWLVINTAAWQHSAGRIDALLVFAPSGVHRNWVDLEIPKHMPDGTDHQCVTWVSGRMGSQRSQRVLQELLDAPGLAVLAVNVEAVLTRPCRVYLERFLRRRKVLAVVDESITVKSPGASRTKAIVALGRRAVSRRICSGAPITQGPLDLYSQFNFLRPGILGFTSFFVFKHAFAKWEDGYNGRTGQTFESLVGYKNQDRLLAACLPHSLRATKEECLDLPPKVYERRPFLLSAEQRTLYNRLRDEFVAEMANREVPVLHVLTRILRLQQVTSGFWPPEREATVCPHCSGSDDGCDRCDHIGYVVVPVPLQSLPNPRLAALSSVLEEVGEERQVLVWARFREDVNQIVSATPGCVRYDGQVSAEDRVVALEKFVSGRARVFVGTPGAGGRGLTLTGASVVVFYSHGWSYEQRIQAEDRAHRIGQTRSVTYVNLVAEDTIDARLLEALEQKHDLAALFDRRDIRSLLT